MTLESSKIKNIDESSDSTRINEEEVEDLTDKQSECNDDGEPETHATLADDDDEDDEETTSRRSFWTERSSTNDSISISTIHTNDKNLDTNKLNAIQPQNSIYNKPMPLMSAQISKPITNSTNLSQIRTPLINLPALLPTPPPPPLMSFQRPLINNQPSPFMFLNSLIGFQQRNDIQSLNQAFCMNNQLNLINTPLYTDFTSTKNYQNNLQSNRNPNKRKYEAPNEEENIKRKTKEPPNKVVKNTNDANKEEESIQSKSEDNLKPNKTIENNSPTAKTVVGEIDADYLKKLEQQKKMRDAILKKKEERRLQRAKEELKNENNEDTKKTMLDKENEKRDSLLPQVPIKPPRLEPIFPINQPISTTIAPQPNIIRNSCHSTNTSSFQLNQNNFMRPKSFNVCSQFVQPPFHSQPNTYSISNNQNNGIFQSPMYFYASQQQNFMNRLTYPSNRFENFNFPLVRMNNFINPMKKNQHQCCVQMQNLSLSTSEKCILDLCSNINIKEKV